MYVYGVCVFTWLVKEKGEEGKEEEEEEGRGGRQKLTRCLTTYLPTHLDSSKNILMRYVFKRVGG